MATRRRASRRTLTGSLSDIDRRLKFVETRPSPSRLANQVVRRTNIQPRAVATDQIQLLSITNSLIEKRTVGEAELDENSVTNLQVAPQAISTESFAPGAVDNAAMGVDSVSTDNYQDGSVTRNKLDSDSVDEDKIANGSITTQKLANGSVTEPKIASSAVTQDKINNGAVTESKIALNAVSSGKIQSGAVTNAKIGGGAVTAGKIGSGAVTTDKIGGGAVTGAKLASQSVSNNNIVSGTLIYTSIAAGNGLNGSSTSMSRGRRFEMSVDFGGDFNEVARGSHGHSFSTATFTRNTQFEDGHRHEYSDARISNISSSKKYKKNISDYEFSDPKALLNLQLRQFQYKSSKRSYHRSANKKWITGYIAEDFEELGLEEAIVRDKKNEVDSLDYNVVSMMLIELAKQQQNEIDSLRQQVERLKEER